MEDKNKQQVLIHTEEKENVSMAFKGAVHLRNLCACFFWVSSSGQVAC